MRTLKRILLTFLWCLGAAALAVAVSSAAERESGDLLVSFAGMRLTVTGVGVFLSLLTLLLFAYVWTAEKRKRKGAAKGNAEWLNALGFGLLPGIAVWKAFEHGTALGTGIPVYEPIPEIPFIISGGRFMVSHIELILAVLCFCILVIWLIARRKDLPGNGDLLWSVLCVWGLIRAWTETFRMFPLLCAGNVNLMQVLFLILSVVPLVLWTVRTGKAQKSTVLTVLEWIAVIACGTVMVLNSSGILSVGSKIGDLIVNTGCVTLSMLLILLTGKDSRD